MKLDDYKKCFLGLKKCDGSCALHSRWKSIAEQMEAMLNETAIDEML
jgi:hypothetical protein